METDSNDPYVRSDMTYPMMHLFVVACVPKWLQTTSITPLHSWKKYKSMIVFITNFRRIARTEGPEKMPGPRLLRNSA